MSARSSLVGRRFSAGIAFLGAATTGAVFTSTSPALGQFFDQRRTITYGDPNVWVAVDEPAVAGVGDKLAAMWMSGNSKAALPIWYAVSTNAGQSWGEHVSLGLGNTLDPTLAAGVDGRIVAAWLGAGGTLSLTPHVAVMEPGSQNTTFGAPIDLWPDAVMQQADLSHISTGPGPAQGSAYYHVVCWKVGAGAILTGRWKGPPLAWETVTEIPKDCGGEECKELLAQVTAAGARVYVTYCDDRPDGQGGRLYQYGLIRSDNYGEHNPESFAHMGLFTQVTQLNLNPYVQGGLAPPHDVKYAVANWCHIAAHPTDLDNLYAVFCDPEGDPDEYGDRDVNVYLMRSTDGGQSWEPERIRVNQDSITVDVRRDQFFPRVHVDARGRLHIIWYDTRRLIRPFPDDPYDIDISYAVSTDGGETFTEYNLGTVIRHRQLTNKGWIGDCTALSSTIDSQARTVVTVVYMGTPLMTGIDGPEGESVDPMNEAIFLRRVIYDP